MVRILAVIALAASPLVYADQPVRTPATGEQYAKADISDAENWKLITFGQPKQLKLRSEVALVLDEREGAIIFGQQIDKLRPVASLTKLLTVLVILDSGLDLKEEITISRADRDLLKGSKSRLPYGTRLSRGELLQVALIGSDNRAAAALGRTYPGGLSAMVVSMNFTAARLGMLHSHFVDSSGLSPENVSTARDLALLAQVARNYPNIETWSSTRTLEVTNRRNGRALEFRNTNGLVHRDHWDLSLSKTGYTSEAGYCMLFRSTIANRPVTVVLLHSWGKHSKYGDSGRIRDWMRAAR